MSAIPAVAVTVTITGSPPQLNWQASPDPLQVNQENLIQYHLINQSPVPLVFCSADIEPSSPQMQVKDVQATQIEVLDEDLSPARFAVYLWVQDPSGQRYRSPDPQVINRP